MRDAAAEVEAAAGCEEVAAEVQAEESSSKGSGLGLASSIEDYIED